LVEAHQARQVSKAGGLVKRASLMTKFGVPKAAPNNFITTQHQQLPLAVHHLRAAL